jgi:hypothetical protein
MDKTHILVHFWLVGFEVLTAIVMESTIFWDIPPCSLLKVNWRFGEICPFNLLGRRISEARNQRVESCKQNISEDPEDGRDVFLRNVDWLSTDYTRRYIPEGRCLQFKLISPISSFTFFHLVLGLYNWSLTKRFSHRNITYISYFLHPITLL